MFHSEDKKGGSFSVGVLQTYVDQKSDPKRLVWAMGDNEIDDKQIVVGDSE